jgi:predicted dinucleotide-binding enzyme
VYLRRRGRVDRVDHLHDPSVRGGIVECRSPGPGLTIGVTTVGFIGSRRIGGMVARLAIAAGYDVVLSNSRGPQNLKDLVKDLGPHARAATPAGAAAEGGLVVVVSIPPRAYPAVPEKPLAGGPGHDQLHAATRQADTRAWWLALQQRCAPAAPRYGARGRGVQQDHLLDLASLAGAAGAADRGALPIAGHDPAAKAAVTGFLDVIGYDTVDAGTLGSGGRRFQFGTRAFVTPYDTFSDQRGTPAGTAAILAALDA